MRINAERGKAGGETMQLNDMRWGTVVLAMTMLIMVASADASEYPLQTEMLQVDDSCGTTYEDKLATCTPFKCRKPSPMAMMGGVPSEEDIQKMPPKRQQKVRAYMAAAEKRIQGMSPEERAAMKARMTSEVEIKGYDSQHRCQIETGMSPKYVMRCAYNAPMLKRVIDYERIIAKADDVESDTSVSTVNGKWVTTSVTKVDGKVVDNPLVEAMNKKKCLTMAKDADRGWIDIDQWNRMTHIELNLSEHGKHVDGHIQILNAADGKVLFDKDVETSKSMRKINLKPGTFDIKVTSKNPQLAPVWFRGMKRGEAKVFKKDVEFYAVTGTLKLTTTKSNPSRVAIYMTDSETHKWIYHSGFDDEHKPVFHYLPVSIKLPETLTGKYEVFVASAPGISFQVPKGAKYQKFLITIMNGETVEKTIDFGNAQSVRNQTGGIQPVQAGSGKAMNGKGKAPPVQRKAKSLGQGSNTLFILDASGSMWGQIKGKPKITIAKEVMAKLVPELPDNSRIGLIAYGHRRKGDCNDVETLVKLGGNHKQSVLNVVNGLNAKGKTPLTRSVNRAFKMLQLEKQPSTIILVSDGIESCNSDPCAAVKAAKASGVNFILHTVGFGLSKKESAQLQCMAKAGGGEYFQANNAEELLKSARKAVQPVGMLKLTVKVNEKVTDLSYRIVDVKTGKIVHQPVLPTHSGSAIRLAGGQYNVFVSPAGVSGANEQKVSLNIKAGELVERVLTFGKGILNLTVMVNGKPAHAYIHIENSITHKGTYESSVFGYDTPLNINLAAGKVDVVVRPDGRNIPEQRMNGIEIVAGKITELVIPVEMKKPTLATVDASGMEQNMDRPGGGDFRHVIPASDNPALCQKACRDDAQCKSWTYVKPNTIQGPQPNCWLKTGTPLAAPNTCCVSGLKR